jgi:hypothetical protein
MVDLGDELEEIPAGLANVVQLSLHEVVPLLDGLELTGREKVDPPEQTEAPLDELARLLQRLDRVVVGQHRERRIRLECVALAQQTFGVADPALDVSPETVVLLVGLPQSVELGGCLAPCLVDLGFEGRRRTLRRGGGVPLVRRLGGPLVGAGGGLPGRRPRHLRCL